MARPSFSPTDFAAAVERVRSGKDAGNENPTPTFDPKLHKEVVADARAGRSIDEFKQVLTHYSFIYAPPGAVVMGRVQKEGVWRRRWREYGNLRVGVTENDLLTMWRSAEDFDQWLKTEILKAKLVARGQHFRGVR